MEMQGEKQGWYKITLAMVFFFFFHWHYSPLWTLACRTR
jgi:hypothetical protein